MVVKLAKDDNVKRLKCIEKTMVKWMYNASVRDCQTSEELRLKLRIESISEAIRMCRLCWFDYMGRKAKNDLAKGVKHFEVKVECQWVDMG